MTTSEMTKAVAAFLYDGIAAGVAGRFAIVEHVEKSDLFFQFYICRGDDEKADGSILVNIVDPENFGEVGFDAQALVASLLQENWHKEPQVIERISERCSNLQQVEALVCDTLPIFLKVYSLDTDSSWVTKLDLNV